ncbi:DNA repair protein RadC [Methanofollis formosanus]|uniref:DNA repair protein RadC n=1 Tax=Methanofollis formosanus TaxID=299308 RepID=A0A8G1A3K4_9EURY|nr:DNA repair protein RadC [Methanofollis formosanus]QYZ80435.1 DNA repair protein RadC [Methanofollis formosanus]
MKRISEVPALDRPREKIAVRGPEALTDRELIAAIIGSGGPGHDVFEVARAIERTLPAEGIPAYADLLAIPGVGAAKASQIAAAFELARRRFVPADVRITTPEDVIPLVRHIAERKQEYFVCLSLNGAGEVVGNRVVTKGLLNYSPVHPREVFADVITDRAASVVFVHNHPSGSPEPSREDIAITRQLLDAAGILGIRVLDHIILTRKNHLSMRERGLL